MILIVIPMMIGVVIAVLGHCTVTVHRAADSATGGALVQ
jgi:hypothetical protein